MSNDLHIFAREAGGTAGYGLFICSAGSSPLNH